MFGSYIKVVFSQEAPVSITRMADHLVDLMDIVASGLLTERPVPLISSAVLEQWVENYEGDQRRNPLQLIKAMKKLLTDTSELEQQQEDALESLTILESEILMPHPRKAIIQGMLSNLQDYPVLITELDDLKKLISPYIQSSCGFH
ncbi:hypothetical protein D3C81_1554760 [compost metagenome]